MVLNNRKKLQLILKKQWNLILGVHIWLLIGLLLLIEMIIISIPLKNTLFTTASVLPLSANFLNLFFHPPLRNKTVSFTFPHISR